MTGAKDIGLRDHALGASLAAVYVVLLLATAPDLAMSRDESFYVTAAEDYSVWFLELFEEPAHAFTREAIDPAWDYNTEHPALLKSLFALSYLAHEKLGLFATPGTAIRFPAMVLMGLLLWLLYVFGARVYGRQAGAFAAVAYALLPQPFYHAHLDCFDAPITFFACLVTYAYFRSLTSAKWLPFLGLSYGLALATKHNAWLFPIVFLVHFGWVVLSERSARKRGEAKAVSYVPWWLLAMAAIGPIVFVASWPWLWNDGLERFRFYANFHLAHVHYNIAYLGYTWFRPPFPIHYPFVMTLYTVPLVITVLTLLGVALRARAFTPFARRFWPNGAVTPDRGCVDVLLVGQLLAPMVVIAMPWTPIFGGTKHWMTGYPFACLFAGYAFALVSRAVSIEASRFGRTASASASAASFALLLAPSAVETVASHPFGIGHYTVPAGGVPGAADQGMNRQFWGYTQGSLALFFEHYLPDGGRIFVCDATFKAWEMMQRDGMLPDNIRPSADIGQSDLVIVHHEDHFAEVDFQTWVAYGTVKPIHVLTYDGVPMVTVYENPRARERRELRQRMHHR